MVLDFRRCSLLLPQITRKRAKRTGSWCREFTIFEDREPLVERVLKHQVVVLLMIGANASLRQQSFRAHLASTF